MSALYPGQPCDGPEHTYPLNATTAVMNTRVSIVSLVTVLTLSTALLSCRPGARAGSPGAPRYDSSATRLLVESMIDAHGGMEAWKRAPTISFDNIFFNPFATDGQDPWWFSRETIEPTTGRVFQEWPAHGATLAFDGQTTWTTGWTIGNPPKFMAHFFFWFVNLPWLTQQEHVALTGLDDAQLPGDPASYHRVQLTFLSDPSEVKSGRDTYTLYIDPVTRLLKGYLYTVGFARMLDIMGVPDGETFGPVLRIHDSFHSTGGLVFPERMHTMAVDGSQTWGHHLITRHSTTRPFLSEWMHRPPGALIDESARDR